MTAKKNQSKTGIVKPPVVVVLGHVDHGKTKLLDYIRKANVTAEEAGGITQHIGAYEIEHNGKKITFIDTPGHEAFSHIRSRGAKAADIAILVIASEEGVKPQTKEAIIHAREAGLPLIVAFNKIDKPEANPEKVKRELAELEVCVESLGGDVPSVNISAKEGMGVNDLLEMVLLVAELHDFRADPTGPANGVILESHLDSQRGPTASLLVTSGTLSKLDWLWVGRNYGRVKAMENFLGVPIVRALPSAPAVITGLLEVSAVGERFQVVSSEDEARMYAEKERGAPRTQDVVAESPAGTGDKGDMKTFFVILKADVLSSLEAIDAELKKITSPEVKIRIIRKDVGAVDEDDVKLAGSTGATIFGFHMKVPAHLHETAKRLQVRIIASDIIYELTAKIREETSKLLSPVITRTQVGRLKILAVFRKESSSRLVVGGKVLSGKVRKGAQFRLMRGGEEVAFGKVLQLQRQKKDTDEVSTGEECGLMVESSESIAVGDTLEFFEETRTRRSL